MDATFLAAAFVNAMPVVARWSCWLGCWTTTALLVQTATFSRCRQITNLLSVEFLDAVIEAEESADNPNTLRLET